MRRWQSSPCERRALRASMCAALTLCALGGCLLGRTGYLYEGDLRGRPLAAPVSVVRDGQGVPHIFADDAGDLFFGLGYVMAQDRLFQMDVYRHAAHGRLCEWFGNVPLGKGMRLVQVDMLLKLLDIHGRAKEGLGRLGGEERRLLERFVEGINWLIEDMRRRPSVEYRVLGLDAEPWSAQDVMSIPELFGVGLGIVNIGTEILSMAMEHAAGSGKAEDFFSRYAGEKPRAATAAAETPGAAPAALFENLLVAARFLGGGLPSGSNNWVVAAERSASGKPLLANDPHVPVGLAPNFWYHAHLEGGGFSVAGLLYAGYPAVICGWNGSAAWGVTNVMADQMDLVLEKIEPNCRDRYLTADGWRSFERKTLQCKVRWGRDRAFVVRTGVHGPLVPEEAMDNSYTRAYPWLRQPVCLRYVETDPALYLEGQLELMQAKDSGSVKRALEKIGAGPTAFNYVWATADGEIGYHAAGRIPIRPGGMGYRPRRGWERSSEWAGVIPFEELPWVENPPQGFFQTANARIAPLDYPWYITADYVRPYRSMRIEQLLERQTSWSAQGLMTIQGDVYNLGAEKVVKILEEVLRERAGKKDPPDPLEAKAIDLLGRWDLQTSAQSGAAALFEVFYQSLLEKTFSDEAGPDLAPILLATNFIAAKVMDSLLEEPDNEWFDDTRTEGRESRDDMFASAFEEALQRCRKKMGKDPAAWSWGRIHTVRLGHAFGLVPLLGRPYRIATIALPGDNDTVNAGYCYWDAHTHTCRVVAGAASRFIVDLGRPEGAWFSCSSGMSGDPASAYFKNLTSGWYRNEYFWTPRAAHPDEIPQGRRLVLAP